jgi:cell division septal protein FtsQ
MPAVKRRKQSIKFRPKYAGRRAKEVSARLGRLAVALAVLGGGVFGAMAARRAWSHNDAFNIRDIILQGDIPSDLEKSLPFNRDSNLFAMRPERAQTELLAAFPELKSLSIRRTWGHDVVVTGHFRGAVAWFTQNGKAKFIDSTGVMFALPADTIDTAHLPKLSWSHDEDRAAMLACLAAWSSKQPTFSSQITECETDTIHRLQVKLADGTVIDWGALDPRVLSLRTQRVMRVLENYHPAKTPATLRFVTDDRLVMDANWAATKPL